MIGRAGHVVSDAGSDEDLVVMNKLAGKLLQDRDALMLN
jgi:hypothetical protein